MLRILTGGVHSSVTQLKTVRACWELFKNLTGGVHSSVSFYLNESVRDRGSKIQWPRMGHAGDDLNRAAPWLRRRRGGRIAHLEAREGVARVQEGCGGSG